MIVPIYVFGNPILRKIAEPIDKDYPGLQELIDNMFETMYKAHGVGLAAPQVGQSIRLITVDASGYGEDFPEAKDFKKTFINAEMIEEKGDEWEFNEGCLSFPGLRENVFRKSVIRFRYYDRDFNLHEEQFDGINARIIQHEYDHLQGIAFVDKINSLKKMLIKGKLNDISKGKVDVSYKIKLPQLKKN